MKIFLFLLFVLPSPCSTLTNPLFSDQELNILCQPFPLISTINDTSFQCARLRTDKNTPTAAFNLHTPPRIILFVIFEIPSNSSLVPLIINFTQSLDSITSVTDIQISVLLPYSNFTINDQMTKVYTPDNIPVLRWQSATNNTYNVIDVIQVGNQKYTGDMSLCKWDFNRWYSLLSRNVSNDVPYAYILKTTNPQFTFTLTDASDQSLLLSPPSPYLGILYCIPYKLGTTEMVLIIVCSTLFILFIIVLSISHYLKGGEGDRTHHFEGYHKRGTHENAVKKHTKKIRRRTSASVTSAEQNDGEISD